AGHAADQVRVRDQPADGAGARHRGAERAAIARRRGDRLSATMQRRAFIALLGAAAASVSWPPAAHAQQPALPVIGYFSGRSQTTDGPMLAAFRQGLSDTGYAEGRNVAIEFRWGEGQYDRLPALAHDLARRNVAVIVTSGGEPTALAAKAATST